MKTHDLKTVRKLTRNHYSQHRMQLTDISEKKLQKHVRMRDDISIKKLENMVALTLLSDESSSESMPLARGTLHSLTLIEKRRYT